jgi:HSP20 family protein
MTALTQWTPFEEMDALQNRLSSFADWSPVRNGRSTAPNEEWSPFIDVIETGDEYHIRADMPGVGKDALSITLEGGELTLKGTRRAEPLAESGHYVLAERPYGTFTRTFVMPDWADASGIQAELKGGVLTVKVRKAEQARARTIAIQGE